ncbi:MAG TPA: hypothetical protein VHZ76_06065 [Gammaproteobacteria bacterium]|nr:hypothetical protein [Gammaproteobacteria bacterium]
MFPIVFNSDSEQYIRTAYAIAGKSNGEFYYFRTWGYPLFLYFLGITSFKTFYIALFFQLLSSALIPALVYATMVYIYPRAAVAAALITWISFAPITLASVIMTDQMTMFFRFLLVYIASRHMFTSATNRDYVYLFAVGFILYLMRPSDALTFLIVPAALLLFRIGDWRKLILIVALFFISVTAFNHIKDKIAVRYTKAKHIVSTSVTGSMMGRMLFFNIYAVGPKLIGKPTLDIQNGPYSKKLVQTLIDWGKNNPLGVKLYTAQGFQSNPDIYKGVDSPEKFASALVAEQGLWAHSVMWLALDQSLGGYKADNLFLRAALESYMANPMSLFLLYDGFVEFFFSGDVVYNSGKRMTWRIIEYASTSQPALSVYIPMNKDFHRKLRRELSKSSDRASPLIFPISKFLFFWITAIKILCVILAICCLPANYAHSKNLACLASVLVAMLIYHAIVAVVFAAPHFRYILPQVPFIIMLSVLGIASFNTLLSKRVSISLV